MPVSKKKRTTSTPDSTTSEPSSPVLPEQQVFHQYLRTLAQSAVRIVIETVMREELDQFIGAAWGECSPKRKGYRSGPLQARVFRHRLVGLRRSTCPETARVNSTRRRLNATDAMNRTLRDRTHPDVCNRDEHPQSGRGGPNLAGSCS